MYYLIYLVIKDTRGKSVLKGYSKIYNRYGMARRAYNRICNRLDNRYKVIEKVSEKDFMYRIYVGDDKTILVWILPSTLIT